MFNSAGKSGLLAVLSMLFILGCTPNIHEQNALVSAATIGDAARITTLLAQGTHPNLALADGTTALFMASQQGHVVVVKLLLNARAQVDARGYKGATPLIIAATAGHKVIVAMLLKQGAQVDMQRKDGATALYMAAQAGYLEVVKQLLAANADVNKLAYRNATALFIAAQVGHHTIIEALAKKGANVNAGLSNGTTPLMAAALKGHVTVTSSLLAYGANVNAQNQAGLNAIKAARQEGHPEVLAMLQKAQLNPRRASSMPEKAQPVIATAPVKQAPQPVKPEPVIAATVPPAVVPANVPSVAQLTAAATKTVSPVSVVPPVVAVQASIPKIDTSLSSKNKPTEQSAKPAEAKEVAGPAVVETSDKLTVASVSKQVDFQSQVEPVVAPPAGKDSFSFDDSDFDNDPSRFGWSVEKFLVAVDAVVTAPETSKAPVAVDAIVDPDLSATLSSVARRVENPDAVKAYVAALQSEASDLSAATVAPTGIVSTGGDSNTVTVQDEKSAQTISDQKVALLDKPAPVKSATQLAGEAAGKQYKSALQLLRDRKYDMARSRLEAFLTTYPGSTLVPSAQYWIAVTHYSQGGYKRAASEFLELYKHYPTSGKVADGLLNLGKSLVAIGKNRAACSALARLKKEYPQAPVRILDSAGSVGLKAGCS